MIDSNTKEVLMKSIFRAATLVALLASPAGATEIVYKPINPSFGGDPLNGPVLLNIANAINRYKDPSIADALSRFTQPSSLTLFTQQLQSLVLSRFLTDSPINIQQGTFDTPSFNIIIAADPLNPKVLHIVTTDKSTGLSSTFDVTTK